jgi:hypothetical protein
MDDIFIGGQPVAVPEAPEAPEKKDDSSLQEVPDVMPPLMEYEFIKGHPYTVEFFNIEAWDILKGEMDVDNIRDKVQQIEQYVQNEIAGRNLENTVSSYHEVLYDVMSGLQMSYNELADSKVSKVANYINQINKQRTRESRRRKMRKRIYGR